jgi:hypothetical protein
MEDNFSEKFKSWEEKAHKTEERKKEFRNSSDTEIKHLYTPSETDYLNDLGFPGELSLYKGYLSQYVQRADSGQ